MSRNLRSGRSQHCLFTAPCISKAPHPSSARKRPMVPLGDFFDLVCEDPMFGCDTWESAESTLQKETATLAMNKAGLNSEDIHLMFAGDLLAQTCSHLLSVPLDLEFPFYGLYGACSTMGESLSLGCLALTAGFGTRVLCATSSHFASAEKEFRFPLGYGNQRPFSATWTVTGSGACILKHSSSRRKSSSALRQRLCCHHRPYCRPGHGLRSQGFHEHGRLHGSCGLRYHCTKLFGFRADAFGL